jgi:tetratricopeptide (TPR) repeat protein
MNNLAVVLDKQDKYDEAEKLYQQTLQLREKVLGNKNADTLISMSNLALVLCMQGKYDEVEKMCLQALQLRKKVLGVEHPLPVPSS